MQEVILMETDGETARILEKTLPGCGLTAEYADNARELSALLESGRCRLLKLRQRQALLTGEELVAGPFSYQTSTLRLYKNGREIPLTGKENVMMKLFLDNVNRVFSKDMLYELVWGNDVVDNNTIMVYIRRLRQKIEDDPANPRYIRNVRGLGYRFVI